MSHNVNVFSNINMDRTKRSSNFSSNEVNVLLTLVDKNKDFVESKKTDRISLEEKVKAWMAIEEEFNEIFDDYRSLKVLKTKYENLKKNVKKKLPTNVSNLCLLKILKSNEQIVGNEPVSDYEYNVTDDEEAAPSSAFNVDKKPTLHKKEIVDLNAAAEQFAFETLLLEEVQPPPKLPKMSNQQKPALQTTEKRKQTIDIWDEVAHKKIKKLNLEMSILEEDWKLRKTKLELELNNVRSESKLREDKLKLEIEVLKHKLENKTSISF